ncbi:hypothetical protein D918_03481 [Trichuris suis]|nr:hypothetical protein D918_03481 [Trichuris suis]
MLPFRMLRCDPTGPVQVHWRLNGGVPRFNGRLDGQSVYVTTLGTERSFQSASSRDWKESDEADQGYAILP